MPNWLIEFLSVLAVSRKTQWAIILGFGFLIGINLLGEHMVSNFELQSQAKGLQEVIAHKFAKKYDKAAFMVFGLFLVTAYKCYRRDKRRFF
ncbi:hypothetical protein [Marinobacter sp.]|uniref:hypothetical protein n=1 Tax=Marinobacter sp. TaxID=50741 RepID=UPI003A8F6FE3